MNGNIQADMSGSSSLTISNGSAQEMEIEASGMCKVNFGGTTETLKVDASGMCNIKVEEVTSECDIDTSGMCKVDVKRRPSQSSRPGGGGWG